MLELPRNLVDPSKNWRDVADSMKGTLNIASTAYGGAKLASGLAKASTSIFDSMGLQPAGAGAYGNISGWGNIKAAVSSAGKDVGAASLLNMSKLKPTNSTSTNLNKMRGLVDEGAGSNVAKGWKVGDPIDNLTKAGNQPSWSAVRQRYWKNEAFNNPKNYSPENIIRMQKGLAPQRFNELTGKMESMELHHVIPQRSNLPGINNYDNLRSVWPDEHQLIDPYRKTGR